MAEILRPMSTGELMDRTLVLYRRNFKLFVGIASLGPATYLVFQLLTVSSTSVRAGSADRVNPFSAASLGFGVLAGFLIMLVEAYKALKGRIWRVLGVFFCMGLLAMLAALVAGLFIVVVSITLSALGITSTSRSPAGTMSAMLVGFATVLIVGLSAMIVWVRYALAIACCVVEDVGVVTSLKRSASLSKGSRFRVFIIYIVFVILAAVAGAALGGLAGAAGALIPNIPARLILVYIAGFIAGALTGPLATIGIALVYYDERVRKEAFDLQLMMASLDSPAPPAAAAAPVQP